MTTTLPIAPGSTRPDWADALRDQYLAGEASLFLVHGNVFDRVLVDGAAVPLVDYLGQRLFGDNKALVAELSWSQGLVARASGKPETATARAAELRSFGMTPSELSSAGMAEALNRVEAQFRKNSTALIVPYADTMLPNGDPSLLSIDERATFTTLHRWSIDEKMAKADVVVVLIVEALNAVNPLLLSSPRVASIEIPLPSEAQRAEIVRRSSPALDDADVALVAQHTSGLRGIQIERIVASQAKGALDETARAALIAQLLASAPGASVPKEAIAERAKKLAAITAGKTEAEILELVAPGAALPEDEAARDQMLRVITARKREIIVKECAGLLEFVDAKHGLEAVGGNEELVAELLDIARLLKGGNRKLAPMGLLCVGPMGAGKTFVVKAFLKEAGLTGVALKNIRSKWNGTTEANLERVLATVKAMGPIAVVIDESDRSFGGKEQADTDGGVSSRVMARLKEFMSDTDNRGQVLFVLMTNRPDRIETDLKRPGRLDRKLPFFYCDSSAERAAVLKAILGRSQDGAGLDWAAVATLCDQMPHYSNADLEAVALLAMAQSERRGVPLDLAGVESAIVDFIPSREEAMIELMELLAVQETSRRSLLPERFQAMSTADINASVARLRQQLRESA